MRLQRLFQSRVIATAACAVSFLIGLAFVFVRAPHPWGWEGIDHYRDLAWSMVRGEAYPSLERAWGYPFFLSLFYRAFGDRQWMPLVVQVACNALLPYLTYVHARRHVDTRVAGAAAALVGTLSFSTIYASTQAADALCAVLFVSSVVAFDHGSGSRRIRWFVASGVLAGIALMFRPNLLLFPPYLAVAAVMLRRRTVSPALLIAYLAGAALVWAPWPIRNYQLTGRFIPATTHGGIQLWYGTLQSGAYFENWFGNPRAQHESSPFSYSQPDGLPVRITATSLVPAHRAEDVALVYWTHRDPRHRSLAPAASGHQWFQFDVPPQPDGTVLMFFVDATWTLPGIDRQRLTVPLAGAGDPRHHTVSSDHFGNLDLNGHLLDIFDLAVMVDHIAWGGSLANMTELDLSKDGGITQADVDLAAGVLTAVWRERNPPRSGQLRALRTADGMSTLEFADGSSLRLPRGLRRTVDIEVHGDDRSAAANTIRSSRTWRSLTLSAADVPAFDRVSELQLFGIATNDYFAKREPFWMDRYNALAAVNIADDPLAFTVASAKRLIRMFVVVGSSDNFRSAQFSGRRVVFAIATMLSLLYLVLFVTGIIVLARRGVRVAWLLVPVVYIPVTLFMMLPNMRYSVTAQPFMLIFVAASIVAGYDRVAGTILSRRHRAHDRERAEAVTAP